MSPTQQYRQGSEMMRLAILMALGAFQGACGSEHPAGNSMAAGSGANLNQGSEPTMSEIRISISTDRGQVTAKLVDNEATRALVRMLPLTIEMRDHLRQEKTGTLPSPLPELQRQTDFSAGTLGLWGDRDFVIYYRNGRVPEPGIIVLGQVTGDLSMFEGPEAVTVRLQWLIDVSQPRCGHGANVRFGSKADVSQMSGMGGKRTLAAPVGVTSPGCAGSFGP